ncbi:hypothetical protein M3231_06310 [Neobacillus mesonae]|nr:hypothetical protein [Neobacillus mesonae]
MTSNSFQFENVEHMEQMADLIIMGTPTENFKDRQHIMTFYKDGSMQDFYTLTELSIDAIFKKPDDFSKDQQTISIIEPVSLDGETKYTDNSYVELQKGDQSVIFLMKNTFGDFGIINSNLGKYSLDNPELSISRMTEEANRQSDADQSDKYIKYREEIFERYNLK